MKADCRNKAQKAQKEEFLLRLLCIFAAILFPIRFSPNAWADDVITNVTSPIVSYQYTEDFSSEVLTNGGAQSPLVSYQYPENLAGEILTNGGIMSPIVSYQYYEWPGNGILNLQNSPVVSYFYNIGPISPNVAVHGQIVDSSGAPLATATITASIFQTSQATAQSASDGSYSLPSLPPGVYVLKAALAGYASSTRALTLNSATAQQNFTLAPLSAPPTVVQTTRQPPAAFTQPQTGPMGSTLKIFNGTAFVAIDPNNKPNPSVMTIVLTHGWVRDPFCNVNSGINSWPTDMAATLRANGVTADKANILGWDWYQAADGCPLPPEENTPPQGGALGQALQDALGANYAQPIHFLGHSLGTMVNAAAANYLHGDQTAQQSVSPTPWSSSQTHMTLFDQAELSSVANTEVLFDGLTIDLDDPVGVLVLAAQVLQGWKPSMPVHSVWADNYISYVGFYLPNTFNIALQKAAGIWGFDANAAHGYPMVWYSKSIVTPTDTALGFQQSFEYDLKAGLPSSTFPASDFQLGDAYHQIAGSSDPLALEPLPPEDVFQAIVPLFGNKADVVVKGTVAVVQFAGDVAVAVANEAAQTDQMISQGYNYVANAAEEGASAAANLFDSAVLHLTLHTRPPSAPQSGNGLVHPNLPDPSGNGTNTPAMAWVPVQIPANALAMAFDFTGSGDPVQDSLVFGIGETNLFSLQAQYVPTNSVSASRLIDVSAWSGQQVELFFGLMGGTSTNATLEIDNIRFYSLQAPSLTIQDTNGAIALSWPSSAAGYVVESTTSLSSPDWEAVTNVPAITADSYLLTNSYPATATFFRLRSR